MRKRSPNPLALDQRLGVTVDNSAAALDCSRSKIYDLIRKGLLATVDIDGMTRVTSDSLRALVATLFANSRHKYTGAKRAVPDLPAVDGPSARQLCTW